MILSLENSLHLEVQLVQLVDTSLQLLCDQRALAMTKRYDGGKPSDSNMGVQTSQDEQVELRVPDNEVEGEQTDEPDDGSSAPPPSPPPKPPASSAVKPCLKKVTESPEEFFQFLGGMIGLGDGIYTSIAAEKINFFSTIKIANNSLALQIFNVAVSVGTRANWFYNFGAALSVLRRLTFPSNEEQSVSTSQKLKSRFTNLTNKHIGHVTGAFVGLYIYVYVMTQLSSQTLDHLFKSADYATINDNRTLSAQIWLNFDQALLISGGLSNLFSYAGSWIDGISGNRTLFHTLFAVSSFTSYVLCRGTNKSKLSDSA